MNHRSTPVFAGNPRSDEESGAPSSLERESDSKAHAKDAELAEAVRRARVELGEDHPLVRKVLKDLRRKERRLSDTTRQPDALTAAIGWRIGRDHYRHQELAPILASLLGEEPGNEVVLPGLPQHRVDMFFPNHRLVVEENQPRHRCSPWRERDAEVRAHCEATGLAYLEVWTREPLTPEHLSARLAEVGIAA